MSRRVNLIAFSIAAAMTVTAALLFVTSPSAVASRRRSAALDERRDVASGDNAAVARASAAVSVTSLLIDERSTRSVARVSGVLTPAREVTLSAEVEGRIEEVLVREHGRVDEGAVLLRLDTTLRRTAVERAEAGLVRARAAHRLAKLELARQEGLVSRQVGSASDLDRGVNQERAAFAGLREAQALLAEARDGLAKSTVHAPFAGTVNWLDLEPGTYVRVGTRVAELLDLSSMEIDVGVMDRQVVALSTDDPVQVRVDVYPGETFEGKIRSIGRAAAADTQRYPVEVLLPNPDERLLAGMVADAIFEIGGDDLTIQIPKRATLREFELDYVFVLESEGSQTLVRRRRVSARPVPFRPQLVEIIAGLSPGDRIAVSPIDQLRDGLVVGVEE